MSEVNKILITRLSSFGDVILTFPLINFLRNKFPQTHISFIVKEKYADLVRLNSKVDEVIVYSDDTERKIKKEISDSTYDIIIDLQNNPRSRILTGVLQNVYRLKKNNLKKFLLVKFKINKLEDSDPVYKRYIKTVAVPFNISEREMEFTTSELDFQIRDDLPNEYVVMAPSSRHFTKTYPKEKFVGYINSHTEQKYVLVGDDSDTDMEICSYIGNNTQNTVNLCGQLSYSQLTGAIAGSKYVICNDSGILHLSEALGKKVTAIFGSTVKEFGFFPQLPDSGVYEVKGLKCRPCSHIGLPACPLGHFKCMNEIELK